MFQQKSSKAMNVGLWIAQILLAALYLMAGANKLFKPITELITMLPWVSGTPEGLVRFIGLSELLGGLGLILPAASRVKPNLTPAAAFGLAIVQLLAIVFHVSRGEFSFLGMNIILLLLAVLIAWGRFKKAPIYARSI